MSFLAELVASGTLRCPACRGTLSLSEAQAACGGCGRTFAFANGALDLYGAHRDAPMRLPDPAFVREVARVLHLPDSPAAIARAARAVAGTHVEAEDPHHAAEIAELADRLGIPGPAPQAPPGPPDTPGAEPRFEWGPCFIEESMRQRTQALRSIRIRNTGTATIASTGARPVFLAYHWRHADGGIAVFEGERSALPVPLAPGRELTVIARIATPKEPGDYVLEFRLVIENVRWLDPAAPGIPVRVTREAAAPAGYRQTGEHYDYGGDHHVAAEMVFAAIRNRWPTTPLRVVEVGGGIHPSLVGLARFGHRLAALDLSFPMSQLGSLYFELADPIGEHIAFVACDATDPPLAEGSFDCAAVFAAVHHFPRPDRLLAALARLLRPGGFIAVMCEPCLPDPASAMYLRDLAKGINEQAWSLPEWDVIFRRAGLRPVEARVDSGSLKAILETRDVSEIGDGLRSPSPEPVPEVR